MDNKNLKNYWLWVAVIIIGGVFIFYFSFDLPGAATQASMMIYFENGETRKFEGPVEPGMTILEALNSSSLGGAFEVRYFLGRGGKVNLFSINNLANGTGKNWQFYLNGRPVNIGEINNIKIKKGDSIEARYE